MSKLPDFDFAAQNGCDSWPSYPRRAPVAKHSYTAIYIASERTVPMYVDREGV